MKLEQQLEKLAELGITLDNGITIDDILYSFNREDYERQPFDLILFVLGIEVERAPYGRTVCSRVWNFDLECIGGSGDYTRITKRLCQVAGNSDQLENISDFVDLDAGTAWLQYEVDGQTKKWPVEINDDWADSLTLNYVMDDIQRDGHRFYFKDNGQAMVLFYFDSATASALNQLSHNALQPVKAE